MAHAFYNFKCLCVVHIVLKKETEQILMARFLTVQHINVTH